MTARSGLVAGLLLRPSVLRGTRSLGAAGAPAGHQRPPPQSQGWRKISCSAGRSAGCLARHQRIRWRHSGERRHKAPVTGRRLLPGCCRRPQNPGHAASAQSGPLRHGGTAAHGHLLQPRCHSQPLRGRLLRPALEGTWSCRRAAPGPGRAARCHLPKPGCWRLTPTWRDLLPEEELAQHDVVVVLEGQVAADHFVEQHTQGPDGGRMAVVAAQADPLGRAVHVCS